MRSRLLRRDVAGLPLPVGIEHDADVIEALVNDEIHRLPDLPFPRFPVTNQHVHAAVGLIKPRRQRQTGRDAQPLPEAAGGGIKEREIFGRVRMAVQNTAAGPKRVQIRDRQPRSSLTLMPDGPAEIGPGSVDNGHGVPLR